MEQSYVVDSFVEAGTRLDVFLADTLDDWTRSQIKKQIDNKGAFINSKQAKAGNTIKPGDIISIPPACPPISASFPPGKSRSA